MASVSILSVPLLLQKPHQVISFPQTIPRIAKVLLDNKKVKEIENYYKKCADDGEHMRISKQVRKQ